MKTINEALIEQMTVINPVAHIIEKNDMREYADGNGHFFDDLLESVGIKDNKIKSRINSISIEISGYEIDSYPDES